MKYEHCQKRPRSRKTFDLLSCFFLNWFKCFCFRFEVVFLRFCKVSPVSKIISLRCFGNAARCPTKTIKFVYNLDSHLLNHLSLFISLSVWSYCEKYTFHSNLSVLLANAPSYLRIPFPSQTAPYLPRLYFITIFIQKTINYLILIESKDLTNYSVKL